MVHYIGHDVYRLIRSVPYIRFHRPGSSLRLLRRHVQSLEAWRDFIPLYASVRCEPLDFLYVYLQCVAALDGFMLHDLLHEHLPRWHAILVGAWLTALAPRAHYHDMLVEARPFAQHPDRGNFQWAVDLAIGSITGQPPPELAEHHALMGCVRAVLASMPQPVVRLRSMPEGGEEEIAELMLIRDRYREQGVEAAQATIAGTRWRYVAPGLSQWKNECVLDSGDGQRLGPNREIWYWSYNF